MEKVYNEAEQLFKEKKMPAAAELFEKILKQDSDNYDIKYKLAICRFRQKQFPIAEGIFRQLIAVKHADFNAWYYVGLCLERQGRKKEAMATYTIVLSLNPNFELAKKKLGIMPKANEVKSSSSEASVFTTESTEGPGEVLYQGNRRILSFIKHWTIILIILLAMIAFFIFNNDSSFILGLVPMALVYLDLFIRSKLTKYTIYEKRIDIARGILFRSHSSTWLYEITNILFSRKPLNIITGDSTITIEAGVFKFKLIGLKPPKGAKSGSLKFMKTLFEELRNTVLKERGEVKKVWI